MGIVGFMPVPFEAARYKTAVTYATNVAQDASGPAHSSLNPYVAGAWLRLLLGRPECSSAFVGNAD